jgi:hypothetical protein
MGCASGAPPPPPPGTLDINLYDIIFLLLIASLKLVPPSFWEELTEALLEQWDPWNRLWMSCLDDWEIKESGSDWFEVGSGREARSLNIWELRILPPPSIMRGSFLAITVFLTLLFSIFYMSVVFTKFFWELCGPWFLLSWPLAALLWSAFFEF